MKKIFTLIAVAMTAISSLATNYTDSLTVTVNGVVSEQHATVQVDKDDNGLMTFSLKNFVLKNDETEMPIGNIVISGLQPMTVGQTPCWNVLATSTSQTETMPLSIGLALILEKSPSTLWPNWQMGAPTPA